MDNKLKVEIVAPDKKCFVGEAYMVVVPGLMGSLGFLPGHVPIVSPLGKGQVTISDSDSSNDSSAKHFNIEGGYVQLSGNNVVILTEHVNPNE